MTYVDGVVTAVANDRKDEFIAFSKKLTPLFRKLGALQVVDCWGETVPEGKLTSFPMAVKCGPDETVCFSWMLWPSKAVRDAGWAAFEADPKLAEMMQPAPFDGKRMIFGGFEVVSEG
ncbi:DUF1428 domain-containing protein [Seohaeicola nanhaiensis]|uniref:DUF1428 domain-containing protein n=1 Tax=Seohaeicola nanhaiensis TaxID=1387282 RepID=A0ABV9KA88_9RHOB